MKNQKIRELIQLFALIGFWLTVIAPALFWFLVIIPNHYPGSTIQNLNAPTRWSDPSCTNYLWSFSWKSNEPVSAIENYYTHKWDTQFAPIRGVMPVTTNMDYATYTPLEIKQPSSDWMVQLTVYVSTDGTFPHRVVTSINHCKSSTLLLVVPQ